jgi:hypothetical protein
LPADFHYYAIIFTMPPDACPFRPAFSLFHFIIIDYFAFIFVRLLLMPILLLSLLLFPSDAFRFHYFIIFISIAPHQIFRFR